MGHRQSDEVESAGNLARHLVKDGPCRRMSLIVKGANLAPVVVVTDIPAETDHRPSRPVGDQGLHLRQVQWSVDHVDEPDAVHLAIIEASGWPAIPGVRPSRSTLAWQGCRMQIAGLVLAAGAGTRFGGPKAPLLVHGERLVDRAVRLLQQAGADPILVVLGAWHGTVPGATVVENPDWESGMGSSLKSGLAALADDAYADVSTVIVTLVDLPGLTAEAILRVMGHPGELVVASYDGERGHPVKLGRSHWSAVADSSRADAGARAYLRDRADVHLVEVGDIASGLDLDHPEDHPGATTT